MIAWHLYCALHLEPIVVLGPKCHTVTCLDVVAAVVHWPSGPIACCAACTDRWREVADRGLGMHLVVEPVTFTPVGLDGP